MEEERSSFVDDEGETIMSLNGSLSEKDATSQFEEIELQKSILHNKSEQNAINSELPMSVKCEIGDQENLKDLAAVEPEESSTNYFEDVGHIPTNIVLEIDSSSKDGTSVNDFTSSIGNLIKLPNMKDLASGEDDSTMEISDTTECPDTLSLHPSKKDMAKLDKQDNEPLPTNQPSTDTTFVEVDKEKISSSKASSSKILENSNYSPAKNSGDSAIDKTDESETDSPSAGLPEETDDTKIAMSSMICSVDEREKSDLSESSSDAIADLVKHEIEHSPTVASEAAITKVAKQENKPFEDVIEKMPKHENTSPTELSEDFVKDSYSSYDDGMQNLTCGGDFETSRPSEAKSTNLANVYQLSNQSIAAVLPESLKHTEAAEQLDSLLSADFEGLPNIEKTILQTQDGGNKNVGQNLSEKIGIKRKRSKSPITMKNIEVESDTECQASDATPSGQRYATRNSKSGNLAPLILNRPRRKL